MYWQYTPYILPLLFCVVLLSVLVLLMWPRRHAPGTALLMGLLLAIMEWSLAYAIEIGCVRLSGKLFWAHIEYLGIVSIPVLWMLFAFKYSDRTRMFRRQDFLALAVIPAITLALVWTNDHHGMIWQNIRLDTSGPFTVIAKTYGPWFWVWAAYTYLALLVSTVVLAQTMNREAHFYRGQSVTLLAVVFFPWAANLCYVSGNNLFHGLDLTPLAFALSGLVWTRALFSYRLMDIIPVARDAVFESMEDGVIVLDEQQRIVDFNPAARAILGGKEERLIGQPAVNLLPEIFTASGEEPSNGSSAELILEETGRVYELRASLLHDQHSAYRGWQVVARDITERKRVQNERRQIDERIRQTQKLESLGALAGGIAHTFNNLLTSILSNSELALMRLPADSPSGEYLRRSEESLQRATELAQQMLAYSGKGHFIVAPRDLSREVAALRPLIESAAPSPLKVEYALAEALPLVEGDEGQIRQVIMSLVTNAAEAIGTEAGTIWVSTAVLDADRAFLAATYPREELPEGRYVCLRVADTGCGMDAKTRARIFDPFFTTKFTGRGLSLAAALGIVRGHRGAIHIESRPGAGSTFTILFPPTEKENRAS